MFAGLIRHSRLSAVAAGLRLRVFRGEGKAVHATEVAVLSLKVCRERPGRRWRQPQPAAHRGRPERVALARGASNRAAAPAPEPTETDTAAVTPASQARTRLQSEEAGAKAGRDHQTQDGRD